MEEPSTFVQTFGDYPLIRILDFLIYSRDFDYPITEIAKNAEVNFQTLKKLWPQLEKTKFVIITRVLGGATLYRINIANPTVKKLIELNNFLCWQNTEEAMKEAVVA
jgi:predicted transcriptional regulator